MNLLSVTLTAAALPVLAASLYLLLLTLLWRRPPVQPQTHHLPRFIVLVPAHNEAQGIATTVQSLLAMDYPASRRQVVVVADNCTDRTADVAAAHGAQVLVRTAPDRRGKGCALQFGIEWLLAQAGDAPWDALVVVDADTDAPPDLLRALAARLNEGEQAVQAAYLPRRGGDTGVGIVTEVALTAFHLVRSSARERLGLSCGLRGNGMAFSRSLLVRVPHTSFSRTEDLEFGVQLGLHGVRVAYAGEAVVRGDMPDREAVVTQQRERWIGGRVAMARRFVPVLLREAVRRPSLMLADLAMDLLVPPLSVLTLLATAGVGISAGAGLVSAGLTTPLAAWGLSFAALVVHVAHAARVARRGRALLRVAWSLPGYALGKALITFRSLRRSDERWVRTPRQGELS